MTFNTSLRDRWTERDRQLAETSTKPLPSSVAPPATPTENGVASDTAATPGSSSGDVSGSRWFEARAAAGARDSQKEEFNLRAQRESSLSYY